MMAGIRYQAAEIDLKECDGRAFLSLTVQSLTLQTLADCILHVLLCDDVAVGEK